MRLRKNKRGISTILAALLLVVISIVSGVIVYAWATGLLGSLMGPPPAVGETLTMDSYHWETDGDLVLYIRNAGEASVTIDKVYARGEMLSATAYTCTVDGATTNDIGIDKVMMITITYTFVTGENEVKVVTLNGNVFTYRVIL